MKKEFQKIIDAVNKLNFILTPSQKKYGVLIFFMSIIYAGLEMAGVSVILPLLDAFLDAEKLMGNSYIQIFITLLGLQSDRQVIFVVCIGVILVYLIKNAYSLFYVWVSNKYSCKVRRELALTILDAYMKQGYTFFIENNSARMVNGLDGDVASVYYIVNNLFTLLSKAFTILGAAILVIIVTPSMSIVLIILVVFCFALSQVLFRKSMAKYGKLIREYNQKARQASLEAIQGSKEVLVMNRQKYFINQFEKNLLGSNRANIQNAIGSSAPTYIIEAICILGLMTMIAWRVLSGADMNSMLTQLSVVVVAVFRILPSLGGMLSCVNTLVFYAPALAESYETVELVKRLAAQEEQKQKIEADELSSIDFSDELVLSHITFCYPNRDAIVLHDLNLKIKKGTSVALIGASGAGKTTLADIILNLLKPQQGEIKMDGYDIKNLGKRWNEIVGYVPQLVYLTDASVRRNIAFGIEESMIDDKKVWKALEMAQLKAFVEALPEKLDTVVGEGGVQLSGGQRQRIAIARALYGNPDILILDEATASLDNDTETTVMEAIDALQRIKTLIIVAHRLTTIRNCDVIYEIVDGKAVLKSKEELPL